MESNKYSDNKIPFYIDMPMKWHKFLIYFELWFAAAINAFNGIRILTGSHLGGKDKTELIYLAHDGLRNIDVIVGILSIGFAVFAIIIRFSLAKYQARGPKCLLIFYVLVRAVSVIDMLFTSIFTGITISVLYDRSIVIDILITVALLLSNKIYYDKRAHIFVN